MTPAQKAALEALAGRALSADQIAAINPLLPVRNDVAIAAALSVGRRALISHKVSARGIREALTVSQAGRLLRLFKSTADAYVTDPTIVPAWLTAVLDKANVPVDEHLDYFDMAACAHEWLQGDGIDMGATKPRSFLDLIALSDPATFGTTVTTLKSLGECDDPIPFNKVSDVLNVAEGRATL
jgi:hypothetical protein